MTQLRTLVRQSIAPTAKDAAAALANPVPTIGYGIPSCYLESAVRATMRALMDAAGNAGAVVKLGFFKVNGELRYMLARPSVNVDGTNQYYTVQDLELSETRGQPVYRRVNLDHVVAASVEFHAADMVVA
jgi:hypothetical protein